MLSVAAAVAVAVAVVVVFCVIVVVIIVVVAAAAAAAAATLAFLGHGCVSLNSSSAALSCLPQRAESSSIRTGSSQDASHKTGLPIEALDINRDRTHAILAGKEILKTVRVQQQDDARVVEETNLRAAVINFADHSQARQRTGLGIQDVKWSHGQFNTHIATAAANGKVILYDLNRAGAELARLHEHTRQVHKLAFNPHQGYLLLSASQDGMVRLWDLRDTRKDIMTCRSREQYAGMNGAIYDIQWSPTDAVEFAFGTDNGTIMRWDYSNNRTAKQKITAHEKPCTTIDWHPDGKHLLSASLDRTVKVWDFSIGVRRQKPVLMLNTPFPVHNARWRPPNWSEEGAYQCTQLATAYDREHPAIHLWDFRRLHMPFREINKFSTAPSDMLWHSRDMLWTVGREGVFQQNDVHHAPKVIDRRTLQAIAVSPSGEISGVAQSRPRGRRSTGLAYPEDTFLVEPRDKRNSPEKSSLRSSADNSFDDSYLSSRRHHGRTASSRSAKSFGSTPPSDSAPKVMFLTDSMTVQHENLRSNQVAFRGVLPGSMNVQIFAYLAQKYKAISLPDPPTLQSFQDMQHVFEQNAEYAQRAAFYRLATTWRFVGLSIAHTTQRRALLQRHRRHFKTKPAALTPSRIQSKYASEKLKAHDDGASQNPVTSASEQSPSTLHSAAQHSTIVESTSNIATPLARPLTNIPSASNEVQQLQLPDLDRDGKIELPPAVTGPYSNHGLLAPSSTNHTSISGRPNFKGPQWYKSSDDLDERRAMVGSWRAPPRVPLSYDQADAGGLNIQVPPRLDRHDSEESFAMFSASTDSQNGNSIPSSLNSTKSRSHPIDVGSRKWPDTSGQSSFGKGDPLLFNTTDQPEELRRSVQISPTTIPTGIDEQHKTSTNNTDYIASSGQGESHQSEEESLEQVAQDIENLRRNNQLLRHDSSESDAFTSSGSNISVFSMLEHSHEMEASGTIVPEGYDDARSPQGYKLPVAIPQATESAPMVSDPAAKDPLLLEDYQAMQGNADEGSSFPMTGLLENLLTFYTDSQADAQTSSLLLLLLAPLLPRTPIDAQQAGADLNATLAAYTETFTALGLSTAQSETIMSTELTQIITAGINPYQAESILQTYHSQLHSLSFYNVAATIRRLCYPVYPAVYEQALKGTQVGLLCLSCKSPINNPKDKMRCETCKRAQAPCPICWGRYPAFDAPNSQKKKKPTSKSRPTVNGRDHNRNNSSQLSDFALAVDGVDDVSPSLPETLSSPKALLWTWCPVCGHGGHTNCLSTWFSDAVMSDGACATEGCLCDCVQGQRREEKIQHLLDLKAEKERVKVVRKGDDWKVSESKAVSAIRGQFDDNPAIVRDMTQNTGSNTGMQGSRAKEDGRRVRLVEPQAD